MMRNSHDDIRDHMTKQKTGMPFKNWACSYSAWEFPKSLLNPFSEQLSSDVKTYNQAPTFFVCISMCFVCMYIFGQVHVLVCVYVHVGAKGQHQLSSSIISHLVF